MKENILNRSYGISMSEFVFFPCLVGLVEAKVVLMWAALSTAAGVDDIECSQGFVGWSCWTVGRKWEVKLRKEKKRNKKMPLR
jgi:hypothetical protein